MLKQIPPQQGASFLLKKGHFLKVIDPKGQQVSDLFCFNANDYREVLSSGRSIDYNDSIFLTTGHALYSNRSNPMLRIHQDTCGRHDFLLTPCSQKMFEIVSGSEDFHASCLDNLTRTFGAFGIEEHEISTTFNIFMNVRLNNKGHVKIDPPLSKAGDHVIFEACMDLLVGLTACSHEGTNNNVCKSILYQTYIPS
jgi:uncharacterized protein YcgI (DUF1989 family)